MEKKKKTFFTLNWWSGQFRLARKDNGTLTVLSFTTWAKVFLHNLCTFFATSLSLYHSMDPSTLCLMMNTCMHPTVRFPCGNDSSFHVWIFFFRASISSFIVWTYFRYFNASVTLVGMCIAHNWCMKSSTGLGNIWVEHDLQLGTLMSCQYKEKASSVVFHSFPWNVIYIQYNHQLDSQK